MLLFMLETGADKDMLEKLYVENEQKLFRLAKKYCTEDQDAEDAVSNAFLNIAEKFSSYRDLSYEELVLLANTSVKNAAVDILRDYRWVSTSTDVEIAEHMEAKKLLEPDIMELILVQYEDEIVTKSLLKIKPESRCLLEMRYGLEMRPRQIASTLSMDPITVRKKLVKSKKELARALEENGYVRQQ